MADIAFSLLINHVEHCFFSCLKTVKLNGQKLAKHKSQNLTGVFWMVATGTCFHEQLSLNLWEHEYLQLKRRF